MCCRMVNICGFVFCADWEMHAEDVEVVVPSRLDTDGHSVTHGRHFLHTHEALTSDDDTDAYYYFEAYGQQLYLDLTPNRAFLSPSLVVSYIGLNGTEDVQIESSPLGAHCFYTGTVQGDPSSVVSLSICHSLVRVSLDVECS